jgi:hypothetical protein
MNHTVHIRNRIRNPRGVVIEALRVRLYNHTTNAGGFRVANDIAMRVAEFRKQLIPMFHDRLT